MGAKDEAFLRFLCEMVHPAVRPGLEEKVNEMITTFNKHLLVDGWELVESGSISGRATFGARRRSTGAVALPAPAHPTDVLSNEYVRELAEKCDSRRVRIFSPDTGCQ